MDKFTTEQPVKIIEFYFENGRTTFATQRSYMRHFNVQHPPFGFGDILNTKCMRISPELFKNLR